MGFSDQQCKRLASQLKKRHIRTRQVGSKQLSYLDGWHVIAEANRIFGYDCWDRKTSQPQRVWEQRTGGQTMVLFATNVSITVRAGASVVTREGIGTGMGSSPSPGDAYEVAIKAAETDATKRALATFGNPFGLALYTKRKAHTPCRRERIHGQAKQADGTSCTAPLTEYVLAVGSAAPQRVGSVGTLMPLFKSAVGCVNTVEELHALWKANRQLLKRLRTEEENGFALVEELITSFKAKADALKTTRAHTVEWPSGPSGGARQALEQLTVDGSEPDVPRLAFPKERRLRDKEHLARVRKEPCLVCGREPSHAHHVRYAQPGAFGMKVSDEFTVPLCALHHDALHKVGSERAWWTAQGINPLAAAARLWAASRVGPPHSEVDQPGPS